MRLLNKELNVQECDATKAHCKFHSTAQKFYSDNSVLCTLCLLDKNVYTAGITINVRISENIIPPTITIPKGTRLVDEAPKLNAIGKAPNEVARLVINIGRKRCV